MTVSIISFDTLPADGGSPITAVRYRRNGGEAIGLVYFGPGTYVSAALTGETVELRAVNVIGSGPWSDVKLAEPTLSDVNSWVYHLGSLAPQTASDIASSNVGLVVIDYETYVDGPVRPYTTAEINALRGTNDKFIVSYISVGEAGLARLRRYSSQ